MIDSSSSDDSGDETPQSIPEVVISAAKPAGDGDGCPDEDREYLRGMLVSQFNSHSGVTPGSAFAMSRGVTEVGDVP
jgi:hypothetical protein